MGDLDQRLRSQSLLESYKYKFLIILDNLSDTIILKYSYETWPTGNLWGDLKNDVILGDLDQSLYWIVKKYQFLTIFTIYQTLFIGSRVMKLGQQVACMETFKIM